MTTIIRTLVLSMLLAPATASAANPDWVYTPDDGKITFVMPADGGVVLTATPKGVTAIDEATGDVLWTRGDMKKVLDSGISLLENVPGDLIAAADGGLGNVPGMGVLRLVNRFNGEDIWKTDNSWLVAWQHADNATNTLWWVGQTANAKGVLSYALVNAELTTGNIRWKVDNTDKEQLFAKKNAAPHQFKARPDKKLSMRMTMNGQQEPVFVDGDIVDAWVSNGAITLTRRDGKTGAKKWQVTPKGMGAPMPGTGYAQMTVVDDVLYIPGAGVQLWAFNLKDGSAHWDNAKTPKQKGAVAFITRKGDNLIVGGTNPAQGKGFVNVLDRKTGAAKWKKPVQTFGMTNFVVQGGKIFFSDQKERFTAIAVEDGSEKLQEKVKLEFGESPGALTKKGDLFVITSDQNVVGISAAGKVAYHTALKAPGPGGFAIAAGVISAAMQAASEMQAASDHASGDSVNARLNEDMADAWGDVSKDLLARKSASKAGENNRYILTKIDAGGEKGPGVVQVDMTTGKKTGQVVIDMREPDYEIDEDTGWVLVNDKSKAIQAFSLQK